MEKDNANQGAAAPRTALLARLAVECRRLADECEVGTNPELIASDFGTADKHCALGWILSRAGDGANPWDVWEQMDKIVPKHLSAYRLRVHDASKHVRETNNRYETLAHPAALAAPLRALAQALDPDAAPAAPKEPQP